MVTATNDYFKDKQFAALNAQANDIKVNVVRNGLMQSISIYDLVVGDLCYVQVSETLDILCISDYYIARNLCII